MKKLEATISPFLLEPVKNALKEIGITGITVSEVQDYFSSGDGAPMFTPRFMLEVVVGEGVCHEAVAAIRSAGEIEATPFAHVLEFGLADVVRIRTSERGGAAI